MTNSLHILRGVSSGLVNSDDAPYGASSCRFTVGYGSFPDKPSVSDGEEAAINPDQSSEAPATVRQHRWAVRAAGLFDGREWHTGRSLVVIDGDTITDVDTSGAEPPSDLDVTDLGRATLLPGLIDAHVHLAFNPQNRTQEGLADRDAGQIADHVRQSARAHLRAGVTTVRDLGDRDYAAVRLRDQPADPADPLPQVLASGPPITRTQGHCWYLGGEADDQAAVADIIARHVEHGVDLIKVMATGGVTTPGWGPHQSQYTRADLTEATEAAHRHGRPITLHAHGAQGIADAVAAGADGIEHGSFFTESGLAPDWTTVAAIAEAGVFLGATEALLPDGVMLNPQMRERLEQRSANFVRMHAEGVRLVCCSDAGLAPRKPHGVLPRGVVHLVSVGMSVTDALASVTTVAAEACGIADRTGRVHPGYRADLIAVPDDPWQRVQSLLDVRAVIRAGQLIGPPSLCQRSPIER
jgi:imidazolonepropionase-like amidohydrolase